MKKTTKKLSLNKVNLTELDKNQMNNVKGGVSGGCTDSCRGTCDTFCSSPEYV